MSSYGLGRWTRIIGMIAAAVLLMTGCLYPKDQRVENRMASLESVLLVQNAVNQYKFATGVLPIKNFTMETPLYERYVIDFKKLRERNMISTIPTTAYENGGGFIFVLIDVESKPTVKLMDLIAFRQAAEIQSKVETYRNNNNGSLPFGVEVAPGFYWLDFKKIGTSTEQIRSVYSNQFLGVLLHESGQVVIDYAIEIMSVMNKLSLLSQEPTFDLRSLLVQETNYVPVFSYPYLWKDNQPTLNNE